MVVDIIMHVCVYVCVNVLKTKSKSDLGEWRGARGEKGWANDQVGAYYYC